MALESLGQKVIFVNALAAIAAVLLIFVFVFKESLPIFTNPEVRQQAGIDRLFFKQEFTEGAEPRWSWQPTSEVPKYSLAPLIIGTLKAALIAMLVAVPLGLGAAIYSSEFAPSGFKQVIKPAIELLAGIPSVVLGFFALLVMASALQNLFGLTFRLNALNAGIALGLAVIPIVFTIAEDAMSAVPDTLRHAALALGAKPWQVSFSMVVPAAAPGIGAGIVLGFGRAIGETMIVLMASGNAAIVSLSFTEPIRTMSATIAAEMAEVVFGDVHYSALFFIGALLFVFTFIVNLGGAYILERVKIRIQGQT